MKAAVAAVIAAPVVMMLFLVLFVVVIAAGGPAAAACSAQGAASTVDPTRVPQGPVAGYGHEQLVNAAEIVTAAADLHLPARAAQIAVMTAMGESSLRVIDHGDTAGPDSRGLFQQRGNGAWGSYQDRMNPHTSATNFLTALTRVTGWEQLAPSIAAHRVQGNADPYHYTPFWAPAGTVIDALTNTPTAAAASPAATSAPSAAAAAGGSSADVGCGSGEAALPLDRPFIITSHFGKRVSPTPGASSNHPATDMVGRCGDPVYAIVPGTVTLSNRLWLSVRSDDGTTVSYLHMHQWDRTVQVGDTVTAGQTIGKVGDEAPATGCHLDLRINTTTTTNPAVTALPEDPTLPGWVDPEDYMAMLGQPLTEGPAS